MAERKIHQTHFTVPAMPWKEENNMDDELPVVEEKIFLVSVHWGMGNFDSYLIKAKDKEDAERKSEVFAGHKHLSIIPVDELDFDNNGVHYL